MPDGATVGPRGRGRLGRAVLVLVGGRRPHEAPRCGRPADLRSGRDVSAPGRLDVATVQRAGGAHPFLPRAPVLRAKPLRLPAAPRERSAACCCRSLSPRSPRSAQARPRARISLGRDGRAAAAARSSRSVSAETARRRALRAALLALAELHHAGVLFTWCRHAEATHDAYEQTGREARTSTRGWSATSRLR